MSTLHELAVMREEAHELRIRFQCTRRVDWTAAEEAMRAVYRSMNLPEPAVILRMDSPLEGAIAARVVGLLRDGWQTFSGSERDRIDAAPSTLISSVSEQVRRSGHEHRAGCCAYSRPPEIDWVWSQISGEIDDRGILAACYSHVFDARTEMIPALILGHIDAGLPENLRHWTPLDNDMLSAQSAVVSIARRLGVAGLDDWQPFERLAAAAGWSWLLRDCAIIADRPSVVRLDDRGRATTWSLPALEWIGGDSC